MESPQANPHVIPGDEAHLHPALIGAALHRGRVGAAEIAATLVGLIASGFVTARPVVVSAIGFFGQAVQRETLELRLAPGKATERHHASHEAPLIRQGHVDGLSRIDRCLLSIIFDRIGHEDRVTLLEVDDFSARFAASYAGAILEWRETAGAMAREAGLLVEGTYTGKAGDLRQLRREVRTRSRALGPVPDLAGLRSSDGRLLELAVLFGSQTRLSRALRLPAPTSVDASPPAGVPDSKRWLYPSILRRW